MDMVVRVERTSADRSKTQIQNLMSVVLLNTKLQPYSKLTNVQAISVLRLNQP